uniref:Ig-like domain-containing protein n=1 Tax=Pelusios castaneus TaxID=367368 RepID=A0A8C8RQ13_9SAUR
MLLSLLQGSAPVLSLKGTHLKVSDSQLGLLGAETAYFFLLIVIYPCSQHLLTVGAGNPPSVIVTLPSYYGRLRVTPRSYSLQLTELRLEDTGTYRAQITMATGTIDRQFTLRVYRKWGRFLLFYFPLIVTFTTCGNETCDYNLTCMVREGGKNVTFRWTYTAGDADVSTGPILHISQRSPAAPPNVTCTAQNPVSNNSTTGFAKEIYACQRLSEAFCFKTRNIEIQAMAQYFWQF